MTIRTLDSFERELEQLRWHLTKDAMLIFYSCIAGKALEGERFLNAVSRRLAGRTIVGFTTYGETSAPVGLPQTPGAVVMNTSSLKAADRNNPNALLTPSGRASAQRARERPIHLGCRSRAAPRECP